jgi:hypothetical protein
VPNAKDISVNTEFLKVMSVGESGSGKSMFASSFPTPGFVFKLWKRDYIIQRKRTLTMKAMI